MKKKMVWLGMAAAALLAAGGSAFAQEGGTKEVTDGLDRTITLPEDVEKVVVTFNLEEYLAVTGEEGIDKLVGFSHDYWKGRREDAWKTYVTKFPQIQELPDVGYNDTISVESIISLDPDVVLMSAPVNYDYIEPELDKFAEAGIEVAFVNYHKQTVEMHRSSTELIGEIMGQEERAKEISDFYEDQVKLIEERISGLEENAERPKVYMEYSIAPNTYGNSWADKMWGALIPQCGGINIAAGLSDGNSVEVAPEQVIASNPDLIVFTGCLVDDNNENIVVGYGADREKALERLQAYKEREGWSGLNAVKNDRMAVLYHDLSRHIFDFAGTQMLAKLCQPELFADVDPEENLRTFFEKYMPVELEGVWMVSLEAEE